MEKDRYIINAARTQTESLLYSSVEFMDILTAYESGELFNNEITRENFDEMVTDVITRCPNINEINANYINKFCNNKPKDDIITDALINLVYYRVGEILSKESENVTFEELTKWEDACMGHGFYLSYTLSEDKLGRMIEDVANKQEDILRNTRSINVTPDEFAKYCMTEFPDTLSEDEIIRKINHYNDGAYVSLPLALDSIIGFLLRDGHYHLWLRLFDIVKYLPLQGRMIYGLRTVEQCVEILNNLDSTRIKHRKVLVYLLLNRMFTLLREEDDLLERNNRNEYLIKNNKKIILQQIDKELQSWNSHRKHTIKRLTQICVQELGAQYMVQWVGNKRNQLLHKAKSYQDIESVILDLFEINISKLSEISDVAFEQIDLNALISSLNIYMESGHFNESIAKEIIESICKQIYKIEGSHLKMWTLNDNDLNEMRQMCKCLVMSKLDGVELMKKYRPISEGLGSLYKDSSNIFGADALWFAILLLQVECVENKDEFVKNETLLFKYYRKESIWDNYLLPFCVGELIVLEILKDLKNEYEKRLILQICDITFVVRVLFANEGKMCDENIDLLLNRIDEEWDISKKMNSSISPQQWKLLDEYIYKLKPNKKQRKLK